MAEVPMVAVEIGTTRMRVLVGESRNNMLMILGLGESPSAGVRKSDVVNFDQVVTALRGALHEAEEKADVTIHSVNLALSGGHIGAEVNRGTVHVVNPQGEITETELDSVRDAARAYGLPTDRERVHTLHQRFFVDGRPVLDPLGMAGDRLEEDALIVHAAATPMANLIKTAETVPVVVEDIAFSALCAGYGVLGPEQKHNGVLVIDLGGGSTSFVVYADQTIAHAGALGVGGDHVTNDIAFGFNLPQAQAERLKCAHGCAVITPQTRSRTATLAPEGAFAGKSVRKVELDVIINARMDELFQWVKAELDRRGLLSKLGAGVVLTGGGSRLNGVTELAQRVFGLSCVIGEPSGLSGLTSIIRGPEYATIAGLLKFAHLHQRQDSANRLTPAALIGGLLGRLKTVGGRR